MRWCDYGAPCCLNPNLVEEPDPWEKGPDVHVFSSKKVDNA
jgi:hypothetical protein